MNTNVLTTEYLTCFFVGVDIADAEKQSKVFTDVLKELSLTVEAKRATSLDKNLEFVTAVRVRIVSLHESCVNLSV